MPSVTVMVPTQDECPRLRIHRRDAPRYSDIAAWIYEQGRWVTRREIGEHFGLTRSSVSSYLNVIAAKRPSIGLLQSQAHNRGSLSARIMTSPDIWLRGTTSTTVHTVHPMPNSSCHARWLALVQLPWSQLADDDRFRGECFGGEPITDDAYCDKG